MKLIVKIFEIMVLSVSFEVSLSAQDKKKSYRERVRFEVELSCPSCVNNIEKNIPYEKGVTDLECSLDGQWVEIEYNINKTDTVKLKEALKKLGKDAKVIEVKK